MDKNFIVAFLLIFAAFAFFNSGIYNEKILGNKPAPPAAMKSASVPVEKKTGEGAFPADTQKMAAPVVVPAATALTLPTIDSTARILTVIGKRYTARFTTRGALAVEWVLADYKSTRNGPLINLLPENAGGLFNLTLGRQTLDNELFECSVADDTLRLKGRDTLVFRCPVGTGWAEKAFVFDPESYQIELFIRTQGLPDPNYRLGWLSGIVETEQDYSGQYADDPVTVFYGDDIDYPVAKDDSAKVIEGLIRWVSLKSKYFSGNFIPPTADNYQITFRKLQKTKASNNEQNFSLFIDGKLENNACRYQIILCPNKYSLLEGFDLKLEKILFKGYAWFFKADVWFPPLCGLVLYLLNFFYGLIPNYGVAIIFLTILSKIVTFPLTQKSAKSMARMKGLQPKIEAIREKHKADPMTMNKTIMKMYKEEGVSPLGAGGCLPMILQMPIFIALFVALRKSIELRGAPFLFWITDLSGPEAVYMLPGKILFFYGPNVSILTFVMAITMYFQSKQTMTDPRQKMMIYLMPAMMLFILNSMPAGLNLYWSLSNALGILQNAMIKPGVIEAAKNDKPKKKGGFFKPLSYNQMVKKIRGKS
ncbi:MAG: YidC/Oxa1 family insertase periplasmic-domain containing protein [Fibrobacterota bacterium]